MFIVRRLPASYIRQRHGSNRDIMTAGVITYEEVKQLSVSGKGTIIDVRNPEEVRGGKIPNSVNIPVAEFEKALKMDPETFRRTYNMDKPQLSDKNIVVHCQMGRRGASAAEIAAALGYIHVRNYAGAYQEWSMKEGK